MDRALASGASCVGSIPTRRIIKKAALISMQKITCLLFVLLISCTAVFAEAIYLKNGRVMTGRIVEKSPKYLVLKTGEGETAVKTTIFLEDINRIEKQGEHFEKPPLSMPFKFLNTTPEIEEALLPSLRTSPGGGSIDWIKNLLAENKQVQASALPETSVASSQENTQEPSGLPKAPGLFFDNIRNSNKQKELFALSAVPTGEGSISGLVSLPEASHLSGVQGDLYVFLLARIEANSYALASWIPYTEIEGLDIRERQVGYQINHVPAGIYRVFAQWHIQSSPKEEAETTSTKTWSFIGTKGDYTGTSRDPVVLTADEHRTGIDVDCSVLNRAEIPAPLLTAQKKIRIKDLYYQMLSAQQIKFVLVVENNSDNPITFLRYNLLINDEKSAQVPVSIFNLGAKEERELDLTLAYEAYKKFIQRKGISSQESSKALRFKITSTDTGEVEFEKILFIP